MQHVSRQMPRVGVLQIGIIACTLITAGVHLYLSSQPDEELRFWFLLNGIGYLVLLSGLFLPWLANLRQIARFALLGYTALTIVLWIILADHKELDVLDATTKAVEVILVVLLLLDLRNTSRSPSAM